MISKLPNQELTDQEYYQIYKNVFDYGSESVLARSDQKSSVIKLFRKNFGHNQASIETIETIRENKFQKLMLLYQHKKKLGEIYPVATYSWHGSFVAYKMPYIDLPTYQDLCGISTSDHYRILKSIKEKLIRWHELEIIYGDIKDDNIFIDPCTFQVDFCDLDNIQIGKCSIDLFSIYATKFVQDYGVLDEKLDSYMLNLMTIEKLEQVRGWYDEVLNWIYQNQVPCYFTLSTAGEIIKQMRKIDKHYQGKYIIDQIKNGL